MFYPLSKAICLALICATLRTSGVGAGTVGRVLFIGNSYTFVNNMPEMVAAMAPRGKRVEIRMVAGGGASLGDHLANSTTRQIVRAGHWDYVVLQEQSALGAHLFVDGLSRVGSPDQYVRAASKWGALIRASGAKPVLVQHWPLRDAPHRDWEALRYAHSLAARAAEAALVHVGDAWMSARAWVGDTALYQSDGSHPTPLGSYLEAASIANLLFGSEIEAMPLQISGHFIGLDEERQPSISTLAELTSFRRNQFAAAVRAAQRIHSLPRRPTKIKFPQLGKGEPLALDRALGEWHGSTTLFPRFFRFPAQVRLTIQSASAGEVEFRFGGKPDDISQPIGRVVVTSDRLSLVATGGPNGSYFYFVGVRRGPRLTGVAEMVLPDGSLLAIGTWSTTRE